MWAQRERGSLAHDDRLDALAMMVAYWIEKLGADQESAEAEHKAELLDQELERFMDSALDPQGRRVRSQGHTWMSRG